MSGNNFSGKRIWIVGASEGLGRAAAHALHEQGASLILSARNQARLDSLAASLPGAITAPLDVTDPVSVSAAARIVGEIDGVVCNAGAYDPMSALDWNSEQAIAMAEVNYLGALRLIGVVLPGFIRRGRGDISLIGSLAGYRGLPNAIGYGASKAALISLGETMRHDLRGSGVVVRVINPGFIKTRLTEKNSFRMPMLMPPEKAAQKVVRAMASPRFRHDFPWPFSMALKALRFLPDWAIYRGNRP